MSRKDFSNLLNRIGLDVFESGRQGVHRRIDTESLRLIDIVAALGETGVPARHALALARRLVDQSGHTPLASPFLSVAYDPTMHEADLALRLREATEQVIQPRRGRPPIR